MNTIEEVRQRLNQALEDTRLADFYGIRRQVKGKGKNHGGLFPKAGENSNYVFHRGGREELQFNIGFEDDDRFRYGVAFGLQPGQNLPDPAKQLASRIDAFNRILPRMPSLSAYEIFIHRRDGSEARLPAGPIPASEVINGNFIFFGVKEYVGPSGVNESAVQRAAAALVGILPLYEEIERHVSDRISVQGKRTTAGNRYAARISYNSMEWRRPAGALDAIENGSSYRSEYGFGHEDWLFRDEWQLGGWRYAFVQGVNRSRKRLLRRGEAFDLELFVLSSHGRSMVCEIRDVEVLNDQQSADAVNAYVKNGWFATMKREAEEAGAHADALDPDLPEQILNIRFRTTNVRRIDVSEPIPNWHPAHRLTRYSLYGVEAPLPDEFARWAGRNGLPELPDSGERQRKLQAGVVTYSPEHQKMQRLLGERLKICYPDAAITFEEDFIDVKLQTDDKLVLYEVKSDLKPLSAIRQALGQLLEYAYHPRRTHEREPSLVIVGRQPLVGEDKEFFERICTQFGLPIGYEFVEL